jgi:hypothetical protein
MREEDEFESLAMRFERRLKGALREMQSSHSFPSRCRSNSSSNAFTLESKGGGEDEEEEDEEEEEGEKEEEEKKRKKMKEKKKERKRRRRRRGWRRRGEKSSRSISCETREERTTKPSRKNC